MKTKNNLKINDQLNINSFTILNFTEETLVFKNGTKILEPCSDYKHFFLLFSEEDVLVLVDNAGYKILVDFVINKMISSKTIKFSTYISDVKGVTVMKLTDFKNSYFDDQLVKLDTTPDTLPEQKVRLRDKIRNLISYIFCGRI